MQTLPNPIRETLQSRTRRALPQRTRLRLFQLPLRLDLLHRLLGQNGDPTALALAAVEDLLAAAEGLLAGFTGRDAGFGDGGCCACGGSGGGCVVGVRCIG